MPSTEVPVGQIPSSIQRVEERLCRLQIERVEGSRRSDRIGPHSQTCPRRYCERRPGIARRFVSPCPCYIGRAAPSIARLAVNPIWPHTDVSIALRMVLSTERVEWVIKRGHSQNQKKATDGERRLRHIQIKLASSASDCRPRRVFWRYCHARRIRQCQEDQPMSNVRDEQRALRDEQRAAIKAAVASANAIIPNLGWHRRAWHGVDTSHNRPTPRRAEEAARHTDADPGRARDWTPAGSAESSR